MSSMLPCENRVQDSRPRFYSLALKEPPHKTMIHTFSFQPKGITSLPVELLAHIFILGAGHDFPFVSSPFLLNPNQDYYAHPSTDFQLLVSHVCQQWRQIAVSTPSLWSIIHFLAPDHLARAREYLTRCSRSEQLLDIVVDTVAEPEYHPSINLFREELQQIFDIIVPHIRRWRSLHLKVRDHDCKACARRYLSTCGPAPNLETLQLYHFEDYRTVQNLYRATYRPPVVVFNNELPRLRNVSLIGVNLPWADSPYLTHLHNLELALHPHNIRPSYEYWDSMLRNSPDLRMLSLHYSGPRIANGDTELEWPAETERLLISALEDLSLTDHDPDYLCLLMRRLLLPKLKKLSLDLPHQDFTSFVELIGGSRGSDEIPASSPLSTNQATLTPSILMVTPSITSVEILPFLVPGRIETFVLTALECSVASLRGMLRALTGLLHLEVHFGRVSDGFFDVLLEDTHSYYCPGEVKTDDDAPPLGANIPYPSSSHTSDCLHARHSNPRRTPLLPRLQTLKAFGLTGEKVQQLINHRERVWSSHSHGLQKWMVAWSSRRKGRDLVLDRLVEYGWEGRNGRRVMLEVFDDEWDDSEKEDDDEEDGQGDGADDE